jgi:[ribosomal protein S18]-alanine N-acetyltransferase
MKPSVRRAHEADVAACAERSAAGWSFRQFEQALELPGTLFLVSELGGHALAHIVLDEVQIVDVAVDAAARRMGVGRSLVAALLGAAGAAGCRKATLEVSAKNEPGQALYRAAGFVVVGRRPKFYNDGSDAVLMDRKIP